MPRSREARNGHAVVHEAPALPSVTCSRELLVEIAERGGEPGRPRVPTRRSPRCASGSSSLPCGSSARRGGSSCTCR
jgi:hypothetical protein